MYDVSCLDEKFNNLLDCFSVDTSFAFLEELYLTNSKNTLYAGPFERFVYSFGSNTEVYTKRERDFIERISQIVVFSQFVLTGKKSSVPCHIIAVDLSSSSNLIYDAIAFMKICNKALASFNSYLIVSDNSVLIGCDDLSHGENMGCNLSFPINTAIDWEALQEIFLYIDDKSFVKYYYSLEDAISTIGDCYPDKEIELPYICCFDEENNEYITIRDLQFAQVDEYNDKYIKDDFAEEVLSSKRDLSFIQSNKVNSFELLIEAESAKETESIPVLEQVSDDDKNTEMSEYQSMLDDPEALIRILKKRNT